MKPSRNRICTAACFYYSSGDIGRRFCMLHHWNESISHNLPRIRMEDAAVITPRECRLQQQLEDLTEMLSHRLMGIPGPITYEKYQEVRVEARKRLKAILDKKRGGTTK